MGYTHYWDLKRDFTAEEWAKITKDTKVILKKAKADGIVICGGLGEGKPEVTDEHIWLNGTCEDDQGHETFVINQEMATEGYNPSFGFCKTAYKPYDAVVTSVLRVMQEIAPEAISISSDGGDKAFEDAPYVINATTVAQDRINETQGTLGV